MKHQIQNLWVQTCEKITNCYSSLLNNSTALIRAPRGKFCKMLIVAHILIAPHGKMWLRYRINSAPWLVDYSVILLHLIYNSSCHVIKSTSLHLSMMGLNNTIFTKQTFILLVKRLTEHLKKQQEKHNITLWSFVKCHHIVSGGPFTVLSDEQVWTTQALWKSIDAFDVLEAVTYCKLCNNALIIYIIYFLNFLAFSVVLRKWNPARNLPCEK